MGLGSICALDTSVRAAEDRLDLVNLSADFGGENPTCGESGLIRLSILQVAIRFVGPPGAKHAPHHGENATDDSPEDGGRGTPLAIRIFSPHFRIPTNASLQQR
jgi:hypothetical protein